MFSLCFIFFLFHLSNQVTAIAEQSERNRINSSQIINFPHLRLNPTRVSLLSWTPRAFVYKGFLSDEECDHLINLAKGRLKRSKVNSGNERREFKSKTRSSSGMFIPFNYDEIVSRIEDRIALWTMIPKVNGESIQILRYKVREKYDDHLDSVPNMGDSESGLFRIATVLMYLSDVEKGGETVFPLIEETEREDDSLSACGRRGVAVKPRKGDALLFFSRLPDGELDVYSMHCGCPVEKGTKWSATKWIRVRPILNN